MPQILLQFVLPLAFEAIKQYIKSSSSVKDDQILELTKSSCQYLASKDNNTLSSGHSAVIQNTRLIEGV